MKYANERIYEEQIPAECIEHWEHEQVCDLLASLADVITSDNLYSFMLHKERKPDCYGYRLSVYVELNPAKEQVIELHKQEDIFLLPQKTFMERLKVCFRYLKTRW